MLKALTKQLLKCYVPSIKFPGKHGVSTTPMTFSGKKIKMTNREALNQALS
jgi:hypothetical protein